MNAFDPFYVVETEGVSFPPLRKWKDQIVKPNSIEWQWSVVMMWWWRVEGADRMFVDIGVLRLLEDLSLGGCAWLTGDDERMTKDVYSLELDRVENDC